MNLSIVKRVIFVFSLFLFLVSCKKEEQIVSKQNISIQSNSNDLVIEYNKADVVFSFENISDHQIEWNVMVVDSFISVDRNEGSLGAQSATELSISLDRNLINSDSLRSTLIISSSYGDQYTVNIMINNYPEDKHRFSFLVKDAVIGDDGIYMISNGVYEDAFAYFDLNTNTFHQQKVMNQPFHQISISPDSEKIALFGAYEIFILNTSDFSLESTYSFDDAISSLVFSTDNKIYALNASNVEHYFHYINLNTDEIVSHDIDIHVYSNMDLFMHPSFNYIYGMSSASNWLLEIVKIDIRNDLPILVYESTLMEGGNKWWQTEDGNRFIFSNSYFYDIDPELPYIDVLDYGSTENLNLVIQSLCEQSVNKHYFFSLDHGSYTYNYDYIIEWDQDFNRIDTLHAEKYLKYVINNSISSYETVGAKVDMLFYDKKRENLIAITRPTEYSYFNLGAIEVIEK